MLVFVFKMMSSSNNSDNNSSSKSSLPSLQTFTTTTTLPLFSSPTTNFLLRSKRRMFSLNLNPKTTFPSRLCLSKSRPFHPSLIRSTTTISPCRRNETSAPSSRTSKWKTSMLTTRIRSSKEFDVWTVSRTSKN